MRTMIKAIVLIVIVMSTTGCLHQLNIDPDAMARSMNQDTRWETVRCQTVAGNTYCDVSMYSSTKISGVVDANGDNHIMIKVTANRDLKDYKDN